jgi:hypothetical protein
MDLAVALVELESLIQDPMTNTMDPVVVEVVLLL